MMNLHQTIIIALLLGFFTFSITKAHESSHPNQTCGTGKPAKKLNFPFGFSSNSIIPLDCTQNQSISLHGFHVMNITSSSIFLSLPAECNRSVSSISKLFGTNHAPTLYNGFLLQKCKNPLNACVIPASLVDRRSGVKGCNVKSGNISCYAQSSDDGFLSIKNITGTKCEYLFSSIAAVDPDRNSLQFQTLELGWWVNGSCNCDPNATCKTVKPPGGGTGFRCRCHDGFVGDGFADGSSCQIG